MAGFCVQEYHKFEINMLSGLGSLLETWRGRNLLLANGCWQDAFPCG